MRSASIALCCFRYRAALSRTGALARTATSIKAGARTPLAGYFKGVLKLGIALFLAPQLGHVPMACIAGILLWVASNMVKPAEIREVREHGTFHMLLLAYTAVAVPLSDFLTGVLSALGIYAVYRLVYAESESVLDQKTQRVVLRKGLVIATADPEQPVKPRAVLGRAASGARRMHHADKLPQHHKWLRHIRQEAFLPRSAFVHPDATVIGRVVLGEHVHIAAGSSVRADEGAPFFIGASSNLQDGVVVHALKDKFVQVDGEQWAVFIGENVSIAHDALIHGPSFIGDDTFVGFKAVVHDSVVGRHCFISHGAIVVGVEVPDGRLVPSGRIVDTPEAVAALPLVGPKHREFNEDVVDVNRGLAVAYRQHEGRHEPSSARRSRAYSEPSDRRSPAAWEERWDSARSIEGI